ncbi:MAG: hypothetical protein ACYC1L_18020 [Alphaproteobacteria bacterium]
MKLSTRSIEMRNRLGLINLAFEQGYVAYLPVVDEGIDLILYSEPKRRFIKVQLKGRWTIDKKYIGRNILIAFSEGENWYLAPHDAMVKIAKQLGFARNWMRTGNYSKVRMNKTLKIAMKKYLFPSRTVKSD